MNCVQGLFKGVQVRIIKEFQKSFEPIVAEIIRTIRHYNLINDHETIALALSGGKDSTTLLYLLWYINKYSYLNFNLVALHVRTDDYNTDSMRVLCDELGVEYVDLKIDMERSLANKKGVCYSCSRFKRLAMWEFMQERSIKRVVFGHHAGDVVETFLMNLLEHNRIDGLKPKLRYEKYPLIVIRPMLTVSEKDIIKVYNTLKLPLLSYECPYESSNIRDTYRDKKTLLDELFGKDELQYRLIKALKNNAIDYRWDKK